MAAFMVKMPIFKETLQEMPGSLQKVFRFIAFQQQPFLPMQMLLQMALYFWLRSGWQLSKAPTTNAQERVGPPPRLRGGIKR